ncbi:MAG: cytidine deaminase [Clostridia bacterium]|nr:cytidine deaminase [Clostridia bacterium]
MKEKLVTMAKQAMKNAYAPYSKFKVGAALLCSDGSIYTGCNIENSSFTPTVCAERVALFKAVSEGKREFSAIAVCGGIDGVLTEKFCHPCGVCRQALSEFCREDFKIYVVSEDVVKEYKLSDLLPFSFEIDIPEESNS